MAKPNKNAPVGQGGRFAAMTARVVKNSDVKDPAAVAASIGRKKYGAHQMAMMARMGRKG